MVALDLVPAPDGWPGGWHSVDCAEPDAVAEVFSTEAVDAVVHLAGHPGESNLPDALRSHTVTTAALLDAMVERDVRRIVYASSNHAVGLTPRSEPVGTQARPRPDSFYGSAKVAAEALLSLYADRHGIDAVACRIGSFRERPDSVRALSTWLSPGDCVRMVEAALTTPAPGFAVLYGISANTRAWWDLEPGRALGYSPRDDAETYAASIVAGDNDDGAVAYVGGEWAAPDFGRPALDRG